MIKLLIDGDMFCYRACSSCEHEINWGHDLWTLHSDLNECKAKVTENLEYAVERALQKYCETTQCAEELDYEVIFCFSDRENNFRKKILATYKQNRAGKRKPVAYSALVEWIKDNYKFREKPELEADDCLGILATMSKSDCIIISGDKDMLSLPSYHYNFLHDEFCYISEQEADYNFFMQALMGDVTDGYSGCPKIGKVTAKKLLDEDCSWNTVVKAYKKAGLSEEVALQQARVARILRAEDYNKGVILWKPHSQD